MYAFGKMEIIWSLVALRGLVAAVASFMAFSAMIAKSAGSTLKCRMAKPAGREKRGKTGVERQGLSTPGGVNCLELPAYFWG